MGKGTDIMRQSAEAVTRRINERLTGFSPEDLKDLATAAVEALPKASAEFFLKSDPAKSRVLRGLMVKYLDDCAKGAAATSRPQPRHVGHVDDLGDI